MTIGTLTLLAALALGPTATDAGAPRGEPLPWGARRGSAHVPYSDGDCSACHERKGPNPGPPALGGDALCFTCHEGLTQHAHAFRHCTRCHNAHDSRREHLLTNDLENCRGCHEAKG